MDTKVVEQSVRAGSDNDFSNVTNEELRTKFVDIEQATQILGFGYSMYTRKLLLEGKLEGAKVQRKGYRKWYISRESIEYYAENNRRNTQLRRFILRADLEQRERIEAALDELDIEYELELSYKGS